MLKGVKRLAQKHHINPKALDVWLVAARDKYEKNSSDNIPDKEDAEKALAPIARMAKELDERLKALSPFIQYRLDDISLDDSALSNLSIDLPHIAGKASDVMKGWSKKKLPDTARNMAMLRITQAWSGLTDKPVIISNARNKKVSDNPTDPAPKYYNGKRYGEFLDFFTAACEIVGMENGADANVKRFIELRGRIKDLL